MEVWGFLCHRSSCRPSAPAMEDLDILGHASTSSSVQQASAEGSLQARSTSSSPSTASAAETAGVSWERIDKLGGPESCNHYAVGWAHAMCTPYQWTKQVASHFGTRNGTIVHWPNGIKANGETRAQFHHDRRRAHVAGGARPQPAMVRGVTQAPIEVSRSTVRRGRQSTRTTRYFEMGGIAHLSPRVDGRDQAPDALGTRRPQEHLG